MLMVIFGAGASYDSSPDFLPPLSSAALTASERLRATGAGREVWRPPLANGLFDNPSQAFSSIVRKYPKLSHILPFLRQRSGGKTVEEVLEQLQDESKGNPEGRRELITVQYYLRDLLFMVTDKWLDETDRTTNYTPLIRDILRLTRSGECVCLVTFNYDLVLDNALLSFDYKLREPDEEFQSHPVLKLFKPHGSVDWARRVLHPIDEILRPEGIIEAADAIQFTSDFRRLAPSQADANPSRQTFFPAIAIPLQNKTENAFVWPQNHLSQFEGLLSTVTKILIIGWQAKEAHFIDLLKNSLPKVGSVMVVGSGPMDAAKTLVHFAESTALVKKAKIEQAAVSNGKFNFKRDRILDPMPDEGAVELSVAPGGFSDFVGNRRVIDFLKT